MVFFVLTGGDDKACEKRVFGDGKGYCRRRSQSAGAPSFVDLRRFVIDFCDGLKDVVVPEILVVQNIDPAYHAEIFDRQSGDLSFFQLVKTGAVRENGDTHILADEVLDGGDVVDFEHHVEIVDGHAEAFQM